MHINRTCKQFQQSIFTYSELISCYMKMSAVHLLIDHSNCACIMFDCHVVLNFQTMFAVYGN